MHIEQLVKYFSGQTTAAEATEVQAWVQADAKNEAIFNHLKKNWNPEYNHRNDLILNTLWQASQAEGATKPMSKWLYAVVILLAAGGVWGLTRTINANITEDFYSGFSDPDTITLPDQNTIWLSPEAELHYLQEDDSVVLSSMGTVYYNISHPHQQLIIRPGYNIEISTNGAQFEVLASPESLAFKVIEGALSLKRADYQQDLRREQALIYSIAKQSFTLDALQIPLEWTDVNLLEAVAELNSFFNVRIEIDKNVDTDKTLNYSGRLTLNEALQHITQSLDLKYRDEGGKTILY